MVRHYYSLRLEALFFGLAFTGCSSRNRKSFSNRPTTAAGFADRVWDMNDVAALIAAQEAPMAKRGPYKKKAA